MIPRTGNPAHVQAVIDAAYVEERERRRGHAAEYIYPAAQRTRHGPYGTHGIVIELPLRLQSEANAHEHWRHRQKRAKAQREAARCVVETYIGSGISLPSGARLRCTITRLAPRLLDSDNAAGSAKHVRDGVADAIGIDDADPRWDWQVQQEKAKRYAVKIDLHPTTPATEEK